MTSIASLLCICVEITGIATFKCLHYPTFPAGRRAAGAGADGVADLPGHVRLHGGHQRWRAHTSPVFTLALSLTS